MAADATPKKTVDFFMLVDNGDLKLKTDEVLGFKWGSLQRR